MLPNPTAIRLAVCLQRSQEDGKGGREMGYFPTGKLGDGETYLRF